MSVETNQSKGKIQITFTDDTTKDFKKIQKKEINRGWSTQFIYDDIFRAINTANETFIKDIQTKGKEILKGKTPYDTAPSRDHDRSYSHHKKHLRDQIETSVRKTSTHKKVISIGWWHGEYGKIAQLVNDGAAGHEITAKNVSKLKVPSPTSPNGARATGGYIFPNGTFHPGFEGRHFLDMSLEEISRIAEDKYKQCLHEAFSRLS